MKKILFVLKILVGSLATAGLFAEALQRDTETTTIHPNIFNGEGYNTERMSNSSSIHPNIFNTGSDITKTTTSSSNGPPASNSASSRRDQASASDQIALAPGRSRALPGCACPSLFHPDSPSGRAWQVFHSCHSSLQCVWEQLFFFLRTQTCANWEIGSE